VARSKSNGLTHTNALDGPISAALYLRVSSAEQAEHGTSLTTQEEQGRSYCRARGWDVVNVFVDEGESGAKSSRPALDRMMGDARDRAFDVVVVAKLDRFGRSQAHTVVLLSDLAESGVRLVSVDESYDETTPSGRLTRNVLMSIAEFERERIAQRMTEGRWQATTDGFWGGGKAPYGYRVVRREGDRRSTLEVDPNEAAMLTFCTDRIIDDGLTCGQIAKLLNEAGDEFAPRRARRWTAPLLRGVLGHAQGLSGRYVWAKNGRFGAVTIKVPAILTPERHASLNQALRFRQRPPRRRNFYLLSRRLFAPCGSSMNGSTANGHDTSRNRTVYLCQKAREGGTCGCRPIPSTVIDQRAWQALADLMREPSTILTISEEEVAAATGLVGQDETARALEETEQHIAMLRTQMTDTVTELAKKGMDAQVIADVSASLQEELTSLERRRRLLERQGETRAARSARRKSLLDFARQATQSIKNAVGHERHQVMALLGVSVHVLGWETCEDCNGAGRHSSCAGIKPVRGTKLPPCDRCGGTGQVANFRLDFRLEDDLGVQVLGASAVAAGNGGISRIPA